MAGCGASSKAEGDDVSPDVQNRLLAALVDHWSLSQPHVVGHDFGGLAALRGNLVNGLQYARQTLIDNVALLPSGSPFFAHAQTYDGAISALQGFVHRATFGAFVNFGSLPGLPETVVEMYFQLWSGAEGQAAFYRQIAQSHPRTLEEIQDRLAPRAFPVHVLWGEFDRKIAVDRGARLAELLGAENFTPIPDAAHSVQKDAPEAVVGRVRSLL